MRQPRNVSFSLLSIPPPGVHRQTELFVADDWRLAMYRYASAATPAPATLLHGHVQPAGRRGAAIPGPSYPFRPMAPALLHSPVLLSVVLQPWLPAVIAMTTGSSHPWPPVGRYRHSLPLPLELAVASCEGGVLAVPCPVPVPLRLAASASLRARRPGEAAQPLGGSSNANQQPPTAVSLREATADGQLRCDPVRNACMVCGCRLSSPSCNVSSSHPFG